MMLLKVLKYCPELNTLTGSVTASLLMCQLEYWFAKTSLQPFYKFLEPCEDECYIPGDSWCEELGFSAFEFRTAFSKIGKVYQSKTDYVKSQDPFDGKLYLSYRDRIKKRTYYLRNTALVEDTLLNLHSQCGYSEDYSKSITSEKTTKDTCITKPTYTPPYVQVLDLFHQTCPSLAPVNTLSPTLKYRLKSLWSQLQSKGLDALTTLQQAFTQVESSDFLCGRTSNSTWIAALDWILKPQKFFAILEGKYKTKPLATPRYTASSSKPQPTSKFSTFLRMENHYFDLAQLEAREMAYQNAQFEKNFKNFSEKRRFCLS